VTNYVAALKVEILSLKARLVASRGYTLNTDMRIESEILLAQIRELEI
tara:strand:- start:322 stop:465 length:144 start_codon:yes stop_codon:yes gene_type:complete